MPCRGRSFGIDATVFLASPWGEYHEGTLGSKIIKRPRSRRRKLSSSSSAPPGARPRPSPGEIGGSPDARLPDRQCLLSHGPFRSGTSPVPTPKGDDVTAETACPKGVRPTGRMGRRPSLPLSLGEPRCSAGCSRVRRQCGHQRGPTPHLSPPPDRCSGLPRSLRVDSRRRVPDNRERPRSLECRRRSLHR